MSTTLAIEDFVTYDVKSPSGLIWVAKPQGRGYPFHVGDVVGSRDPQGGYWRTRLDGRRYLNHRVVFFLFNAIWPDRDIDHVNGNPSDNRIENLRLAERFQNNGNAKLSSANTSGFRGVCWAPKKGKWVAQIKIDYAPIFLGHFNSAEMAARAYDAAAMKRFGEFARLNFGVTP